MTPHVRHIGECFQDGYMTCEGAIAADRFPSLESLAENVDYTL
ncbi:hypothetical protein [Sphingomonas sp. Root710]|nr:hypothetical protein [Sphingomonas sp. Root710]